MIVNQVKHNLRWAKMLQEKTVDDENAFVVEDQDGRKHKLTFDVDAFKANVQSINALPAAAKLILAKNPWERTAADIKYIVPFVIKVEYVM